MNILTECTKQICKDYIDEDNNMYEEAKGITAKRNLGKKEQDFLKRYIDFVINTKAISNIMKIYLKGTGSSVASVIKSYNQILPQENQINIKAATNKVYNDTKKLLGMFPEDMLSNILSKSSKCNLDLYNKKLNFAIANGSKNKLLDNLMLKLPARIEIQEDLSDDDFLAFLDIIAPFFKKHIKYLEENLETKAVGYLQFLMSSNEGQLSGKNKDRYKIISAMLN
ncbi:hypothetical protein [Clostridium sp.]|uniref:hypothetical protein n=1 Tax=Clostridium sp. TaxID=1506 RepID=UPI001A3784E9|nr:hypothetical protein [Clostridium sp.]MBK5240240.1 hypothetical protein [Clostridium sp.]